MTFAFLFFDSVGGTEWLVLLGVILIVVGPKNLPSAARKLGSVMAKLRRAADEFKRQLMSMDEEFRRGVEDVARTDYTSTPSDEASKVPDDAGSSPSDGGSDRAESETDYYGGYDENSPYPGHDYYDETQYQDGTGDATSEGGAAAQDSSSNPPPAEEPPKPKSDPYAIKITVTTSESAGRGKSA